MADFLASFQVGAAPSTPSDNVLCDSVEDLQSRLREALDSKTSPTRAEHVAVTLDISALAQFRLSLTESEDNVLEGLNQIDPSLGGVASAALGDAMGSTPLRVVNAQEVLMDRAGHEDMMLHTSVASHIASAIGEMDGSRWVAGEPSKETLGIKVVFQCADSLQEWQRQHKDQPKTKAIIGDYSQREPDAELMARPAFDCRGTITIIFSRANRAISVKYNHTPLHQTVGQLAEMYKPPPRAEAPVTKKQKTPKKPPSARKKREPNDTPGEGPKPKKRKKHNNGEAQTVGAEGTESAESAESAEHMAEGAVTGTDYPEAILDGAPQQESTFGSGQQPVGDESQVDAFNQYPQNMFEDNPPPPDTQYAPKPTQPVASTGFPIHVSAEEAARRKKVATAILSEAGVEPNTLSADQFNIFSNQAPELQKESLNMLVKYGAERLRIVHPNARESSSTPASGATTPKQSTQATPSGPMTTKELAPQGSSTKTDTQEKSATPVKSRARVGKSRVACFSCKNRRVKCPHEKPSCAECVLAGLECEYPAVKPRKKKSAAVITAEDDDNNDNNDNDNDEFPRQADETQLDNTEMEDTHMEDTHMEDTHMDDTHMDGTHLDEGQRDEEQNVDGQHMQTDYSQYPQMPVSDMLTPNIDSHADTGGHSSQTNYFPNSPPSLAMPQAEVPAGLHPSNMEHPNITMPQDDSYYSTDLEPTVSIPVGLQQDDASTMLGHSTSHNHHSTSGQGSISPRRISSRSSQGDASSRSRLPQGPAIGWPRNNHSSSRSAFSSASNQPPTSKGHDRRISQPGHRASSPTSNLLEEAALLSHAALQQSQPSQPSPQATAMSQVKSRASSFQGADQSRSNSRQEQRGGSRSLLADHPLSDTSTFHTPGAPGQHMSMDGSRSPAQPEINSTQSYNSYARFGDAPEQTRGGRVAYEPFQQNKSASDSSAYSSYGQGRSSTSSLSMPGQVGGSVSSMGMNNTLNAGSLGGSHSHNSLHRGGQGYGAPSPFRQPSNSSSRSSAVRELDLRASAQASRSSLGSLNQQAQQGHSFQQGGQSGSNQTEWYHLDNTSNPSMGSGNQGPNYSW